MPRKSIVTRMPAEQRRYVEKLLRADQLTLDEMLDDIRAKYPAAEHLPSRSGLGRYAQQARALGQRARDLQLAGAAMVKEFGEDPHDRAGQLLVEAITSLATRATLKAEEDDTANAREIGQLARNARAVMEARKMSLAERQEIARIAREAQVREQADKLDAVTKAGGLSAAAAATIRKQILGMA